jgi:CheY-like chemotaxis protein
MKEAGVSVPRVVLPVNKQALGMAAARHVLVVEDDLISQLLIKAILGKQGCSVEIAPTGVHALRLLEKHPFDLILMDCNMPEMDGFEATRRIRATADNSRFTPIVAVTANVLPADRQRCLDAGMDDYVCKPIEMKALLAVLLKWNRLTTGDAWETSR